MKAYSTGACGSAQMTPDYTEGDTVYFDDNLTFTGTCDQVTFTLSIRDGSANLIRTIASTTYNVGTTGALNMSSDIFGGTQSWTIPTGSTGALTARINTGSSGINNEYSETQIYVDTAASLSISGTNLSSNSITQNEYTKVTCTTGTTSDYSICTIIKGNVVKASKEMDRTGTAAEVLFYPWEIGTCTTGTVQITSWKGSDSARDNTAVLTVANGTASPESNWYNEMLTCLRNNATITAAIPVGKIEILRDLDLKNLDSSKIPGIFVVPDVTESEHANVAEYEHHIKCGILLVEKKYEKKSVDDVLDFVQDYANIVRDTITDYDWVSVRQITVKRTGHEARYRNTLLYYSLLTVNAEVID